LSKGKVILLVVLGLVLAGAIFATVLLMQNPPAEEEGKDLILVSDAGYEAIESIKITQAGSTIEVQRTDGGWKAAGSDALVDKLTSEGMATYLSYVYAVEVIENSPQDLERYGLGKPSLIAQISLKDGSSIAFSFGLETIDKTGVYFMKSGDANLYTMMAEHFAQIKSTLNELMDVSLPAVDKDNMATLAYKMGNIEQSLTRSDVYESGFAFDDTGVAAASVFIEQVQKTVESRLFAYVGAEIKAEYGLSKGDYIKIADTSGKTLNITLGGRREDKKIYCTVEGKPGVYLAGEEFTSFIIDNLYLCMDWRLIPAAVENIVSLEFTGGGKNIALHSENGKYTKNAQEIAKADYDALLHAFTAIESPGAIDRQPEGKAVYNLKVKLKNGQSINVAILPFLKGFYALDFGKEPYLYIKADALDSIK